MTLDLPKVDPERRRKSLEPAVLPDYSGVTHKRATPQAQAAATSTRPVMKRRYGAPKPVDWYLFASELKTLLGAGVPLVQALVLLEESSDRERVKKAAIFLGRATKDGTDFVKSLDDPRNGMPDLLRMMLIAGQRSGRLVETLELSIRHYQWMREIRSNILRVVIYPMAQVIIGVTIMIARDTIISSIRGGEVGGAFFTFFLRYAGPVIVGAFAALGAVWLLKLGHLRNAVDRILITIPLIGKVLERYSIATFLDVFASTLESGTPILDAYGMAIRATPNRAIADGLDRWSHFLRDGESITETFTRTKLFEPQALGMVHAGEVAASTPTLMRRMAGYYYDTLKHQVNMLVVTLAPIATVFIAVGYFLVPSILGWMAFVMIFMMKVI